MQYPDDVFGPVSPTVGRYQAMHTSQPETPVDLKGSTGDKWKFIVKHPKIEIIGFGFSVTTALGAATTINAVVNLDKQLKDNGARAIANSRAALTFDGTNNVLASVQFVDLNLNITETPLEGPPSRPTAVFGDQLVFELITAGTGSAVQTVLPFIVYRERTV